MQKVVQIAEVYERKQIDGSKYSIDILCDFVFDKAKKHALKVTKYQNELKQLQQERSLLLASNNSKKYRDEIEVLKRSNQQLRKDLRRHVEVSRSRQSDSTSRSLQEL